MEQRIKFPRSEKVYLSGKLFPEIRVGMRKVEQVPSTTFEGEKKVITPNPHVYIYDTSGPFSDPDIEIDPNGVCQTGHCHSRNGICGYP